jgi:hypothetical protein
MIRCWYPSGMLLARALIQGGYSGGDPLFSPGDTQNVLAELDDRQV